MSKSNVICGAKNILATSMSLILQNYFFITVKDQYEIFELHKDRMKIYLAVLVARYGRREDVENLTPNLHILI